LDDDYIPPASSKRSGNESLAERWILHKFNEASREINAALANRQFSDAAQISYQFWYTNLCDVFIENSKSLISNGTPEEQASAKATLYTCIDGAVSQVSTIAYLEITCSSYE
jgi:valyl-tRNA synthetase